MLLSHSTRVRGLKFLEPSMQRGCSSSRTLHECVDWNRTILSSQKKLTCRTLHECVDWNFFKLLYGLANGSRTLHECVDWNYATFETGTDFGLSHSTRVRGLKFSRWRAREVWRFVALYTSAWIEILIKAGCLFECVSRTLHECVDWNWLLIVF